MLLEIESLEVSYRGVKALKGIDLQVDQGEIVAIVGRNGAGKSTICNTISGLVRPTAGSIRFSGKEITTSSPAQIVAMGVAQVPEGRHIFAPMTVEENLEVGAYHRMGRESSGEISKDMEMVFGLFPILKERRRQQAGTLSGGEQQMLAIGRALMSNARLLVLDEPSLGLAPVVVQEIFRVIKGLPGSGVTVLLVEQNVHLAFNLAHRLYIMNTGTIESSGTPEELKGREGIIQAYLGKRRRWCAVR